MKYILTVFFSGCVSFLCAQDLKLRYDQPAKHWEETLPLGNGLIGMMPDGKVSEEQLQLFPTQPQLYYYNGLANNQLKNYKKTHCYQIEKITFINSKFNVKDTTS